MADVQNDMMDNCVETELKMKKQDRTIELMGTMCCFGWEQKSKMDGWARPSGVTAPLIEMTSPSL